MMAGAARIFSFPNLLSGFVLLLGVFGCSASQPPAPQSAPAPATAAVASTPASSTAAQRPLFTPPAEVTTGSPIKPAPIFPVMLGIDVLESDGFAAVKGKRIGLLTHPAGVNRRGVSTVDVLRRAPNTKLIALFAPEHGLYGTDKASANIADTVDRRTGLPVYSLHGQNRKPTKEQLKELDALVIDLQDIGVRSYTFNVAMRYAMDACFTHGIEVIVLDRPNPLGGLKVDGPLLDRELMSGVGAFRIPYVHGLTMGELARMAATAPGVLDVSEDVRKKGRLTVLPMRGWRRNMRWSETGLTFVQTSQLVPDFAAVIGYAMVGLGCEGNPFSHGLGAAYPYRGIAYPGKTPEQLQKDLTALRLPGIRFSKVSVNDRKGQPTTGIFVEVTDWADWNPTELSFHMMRLACRYETVNPFAKLNEAQFRSFNIHVGSRAWGNALRAEGARIDVEAWVRRWREQAAIYQAEAKKFWLYQ
jgi:uncharacterized protein YbbC (DUF1343 family)